MTFYDPIYGHVLIPEDFQPILSHPLFRRLQHLRQLGLCYLAFPGGNHTRYEHSIGAFHVASLLAKTIEQSNAGSIAERERLATLIQVAALCHDLGHGPFSHMSENVLHSLGCSLNHEEIGARLLTQFFAKEFGPLRARGITPEMVARTITKSFFGDTVGDCAVTLISSDVDVDRIDYLLRDSHYAGQGSMLGSTIKDLSEMWQFKCVNGRFSCELTEAGIRFAETLLMLRRDNYRRIVFDSAHMAATAMFEKAMHYAVQQQSSPFSKMVKAAILASKKWSGDKLPKTVIQPVMVIFGLVDFEALHLLETSSEGSQYLIRGIRFGQLYESAAKRHWEQIHHSIRRRLVGLKNHKDTFQFRRDCEKIIATAAKIDERHVAVHALPVRAPGPLLFGVYDGRTLHDASELSRFLVDDFFKQYTIEVFADHQLSPPQVQTIQDTFAMIFERGEIEPST